MLDGSDHEDDLVLAMTMLASLFLEAGLTLEKIQEPTWGNNNEHKLKDRLPMHLFC
jgi:hypothetical protein